MHHDISLIATVAVGFVLASVFGYFADRLRLPPLVGYLVAGILAGPFTPGHMADTAIAGQLAEMGVILLMFGVGLHFSAADLLAVRGIAVLGAIGQIVLATLLGTALAMSWGWSLGEGVVLGLSLSVASTVVLLKALEERNLVNTANGRVAIGWLIVEDLAMVVALVLLPAFAQFLGGNVEHSASDQPVLISLVLTLVKVAAFAALAMVVGPRVVPWVLVHVARTGSRELFTLSVLALAVGIAFGSAEIFGVSFALGAFFAGVVMSESDLSHKAAADSLPLQDAFSVLFFVSVGMLFDPTILVRQPLEVLAVLLLIMLGKAIIAFGIVLALRYPFGTALMVAASLSQIGEFSFILAGLGVSYGLLSQDGQDLVLAGALLSITLNPLMFSFAAEAQRRIRMRFPESARYGKQRFDTLLEQLEKNRVKAEARDQQRELRTRELLDRFPLLSLVDHHALEELLLLFRPKQASPGDRVIRKGDRGDSMYFVSSGAVEVRVGDRAIRLDAGSFFGEMALLTGERRTADVAALDFCNFLVLDRRDFNQYMSRHPALREAMSKLANERRAMNMSPNSPPAAG
ncbi:MAG: cation:proton antiporter [Rhizobiaceae bacterium]|nr:cation:proton antiporter [Rhizobiaceae bacterium]